MAREQVFINYFCLIFLRQNKESYFVKCVLLFIYYCELITFFSFSSSFKQNKESYLAITNERESCNVSLLKPKKGSLQVWIQLTEGNQSKRK